MADCPVEAEAKVPTVARFVGELHGYERLLSAVFAAGGRLQSAAIEAQATEKLSPIAGHQVLAAISASQAAIALALGQAANGHRLAEKLGKLLGLDVSAYGDTWKPPESAVVVEGSLNPDAA